MTTTTKIFVILVCLFAFIFTPMTIQFAARTYNWKALADVYRGNAEVALANEQHLKALSKSLAEQNRSMLAEAQKRELDAQQRIADLERKLDTLTNDRDQLARSHDLLQAQGLILNADLKVKSDLNTELSDAKEKALARNRELESTNIWLTDQLQAKKADAEVLQQQLNQKKQELMAFREENEQLRKSLNMGKAGEPLTAGPAASVEAITPAARSPIQGKVTEVRNKLASIDVGATSGVKEGMKIVVLRNNHYVCDLKITSVTPNEAVGEVALVGSEGLQVRSGDSIVDESTLMNMKQ